MQLVAAIAAQRAEHVAGEAGRVQPHQRHGPLVGLAHHQHERLLRLVLHAVEDQLELAVPRGQLGLGDAIDQLLAHAAIADQLFDRDDFQVVLARPARTAARAWPDRRRRRGFRTARRRAPVRPCAPGRPWLRCGPRGAARRLPWPPAETGGRAARSRPACWPGR